MRLFYVSVPAVSAFGLDRRLPTGILTRMQLPAY
jgi:hypothetical protein